jgi:hypothetical protein
MPIVLTDSHAPVLIATLSGEVTDKEYAAHVVQFEAMSVARGRPYAYVYDATLGRSMPPTTRQIQADWIIEHKPLIQKLCCGVAFVVGSAIQRGVLTAVHWLSPPPYAYAVYARRAEATKWCIEQLRARRIALPPDVDSFRAW